MRLSDLEFNESKELEIDIPLYRGVRRPMEGVNPFHFRDKPKDTPLVFHNYVNDKTQELFGLPIRNLVFATPAKETASLYGTFVYRVTPVNSFRIFSSTKYSDFTMDLRLTPRNFLFSLMKKLKDEFQVKPSEMGKSTLSNIKQLSSWNDVKQYCRNVVESFQLDIDQKHLNSIFDSMINDYINRLDDYIRSIIEIKDVSQIQQLKDDAEIMIYSPDGLKYQ